MIIIYIYLLIIVSVKSRLYNTLYEIYLNITKHMHELPLNFIINGTNDYSYHFICQDILYRFNIISFNNTNGQINFRHQNIKFLYNLKLYEYNTRLFDFSTEDIKFSENIIVDIKFKELKFFQEGNDFSFGFKYEIDDFDNDIKIHFENIDKLNTFKYLFLHEKNDIYGNNTLENLIKVNILKRLTEEVKHSLIYYPPCDAVDFFKSIIHYLKDQLFSVDLKIYQIGYSCLAIYKVKVLEISYEDIIKDNNTIIFKNVNTTSYMLFCDENPDDYDKDIFDEETISFLTDFIKIDKDMNIIYGSTKTEMEYALEALKVVVNMTIHIIEKNTKK